METFNSIASNHSSGGGNRFGGQGAQREQAGQGALRGQRRQGSRCSSGGTP